MGKILVKYSYHFVCDDYHCIFTKIRFQKFIVYKTDVYRVIRREETIFTGKRKIWLVSGIFSM